MHQEQFVVGPETIRMLELGHPWIIADSHTRKWPTGKAGDLVELTDANGRLVAMALLDPSDRIVARVLAHKRMHLDREWLLKRLGQAMQLRNSHANLVGTTAYRVVNGEGDGLPGLTVDRYGDYLMVQLYCGGWRQHLKLITQALQELLSPMGIYEKSRPQNTRELEAVTETKTMAVCCAGPRHHNHCRSRKMVSTSLSISNKA